LSLHSASVALSCMVTASPSPGIYPLSLHDALPIFVQRRRRRALRGERLQDGLGDLQGRDAPGLGRRDLSGVVDVPRGRAVRRARSEEHTSELQSRENLVCRLLLEKKNNITEVVPLP